MRTYVALTVDRSNALSKAICATTRGQWSHALIAFGQTGRTEPTDYYESLYATSSGMIIDGVRGPMPFHELRDWLAQDPKNRKAIIAETHFTHAESYAARRHADATVGRVKYGWLDIPKLATAATTGWMIAEPRATRKAQTCAEFVARSIPAWAALAYLSIGEWTYDFVIPDGPALPSIRAAFTHWRPVKPL